MTNVRSRFNDWMFKALFFIITISLMSLTANGVLAVDIGEIKFDPSSSTYDGLPHAPKIKVYDSDTKEKEITNEVDISYKGTKAGVEGTSYTQTTADAKHFTDADTITFTVKGKTGGAYKDAASKDVSYTIAQKDISESPSMLKNIDSQAYTGSPIEPTVIVTDGDKPPLVQGTDYTVNFKNNIEVGEATVTIKGIGNYTGEFSDKFNITPMDISKGKTVGIKYNIGDQVYTGSAIKPTGISVVYDTNDGKVKTLKEGTDYTIEYPSTGNVDVGKGKLTIVGKGNYTGKLEATFNINAQTLSADMIADIPNQEYTGSEIKPVVTLKDGSALPKGFKVEYANNIEVSTKDKEAKVTISAGDDKNYSLKDDKAIEKIFTIVAKQITDPMVSASNQVYTGSEIKVSDAVTVTDAVNGKVLKEGTDYKLEILSKDYKNVGTVKIKVTGQGNYSGEVEKTFDITPATVTFSDLSASRIIYGESLAESKITGKAFDSNNQEIEGTFEFVNPLIKPELKDKANLQEEYEATVIFKSKDGNFVCEVKVIVRVVNLGEPILNNGIMNWVSKNGTTSTKIQATGISWLKEDSENSFTWYGIENILKKDGTPLFEPGSIFWVRWLSKNDPDWDEEYAKIDPKYKEDVDNGRLYIFKMGVIAPDGTEIEMLGTYIDPAGNIQNYLANIYIQLGSDWDERDIRSICILNGKDEKIRVSYVDNIPSAPLSGRFAKLEVPHFSTWGCYDSLFGGSDGFYTSGTKSSKSTTGTGSTLLGSTGSTTSGSTTSGSSSSKGSSTSGSGTSYGSLNLYKSTGEDKYALMMPMILPIVLFVLIYGKKRVNKDL